MKVTFFSNYLNHHQLPFSNAMRALTNNGYSFVATTCFNEKRLSLGYDDMNKAYSFVVRAYESEKAQREAEDLALNSDVIIAGAAPEKYVSMRIAQNKLTFRYAERSYKNGYFNWKVPLKLIRGLWRDTRWFDRKLFMLCASAYTAHDWSLHGAYINKTFKWGYFPETKIYDIGSLIKQKDKHQILWVGRFLDWKHPDDVLLVAQKLKKDGLQFHINIVGTGDMEKQLKDMALTLRVEDRVNFVGSVPFNQVRSYMEKAGIFLFTSDYNEGWGAVLNESMNSGCAVVASHAIGAVPFLIKNNVNGIIYNSGNTEELYKKVKVLLESPLEQERLGGGAYETIVNEWNAEVAAERLLRLVDCINGGGDYNNLFARGPCSRAEIIKDDWFDEK